MNENIIKAQKVVRTSGRLLRFVGVFVAVTYGLSIVTATLPSQQVNAWWCTCCNANSDGSASGNGCGSCADQDCKSGSSGCNGASGCNQCGNGRAANACGGSGGNGGGCDGSAPTTKAALSGPADGSVDLDIPVTLSWTNTAGWGDGCGGANSFVVGILPMPATNVCPTTGYKSFGATSASVKSLSVSNLDWETTYCWVVIKTNTKFSNVTAPWKFTTASLPKLTNVNISGATKCGGAQVSGRTDEADTNNPITLSMDVSSIYNNFSSGINRLVGVRLGIVGIGDQNAATITSAVLEPTLSDRMGFAVAPMIPGQGVYNAVNSIHAPLFSGAKSSGDFTNAVGNSTVLSLNSASNIQQIDNKTMRVTWLLRFENSFITSKDNIYVAALGMTPAGTVVSQAATGAGVEAIVYGKTIGWATDMQKPNASVSQPIALSPATFKVTWTANDSTTGNNGIRDFRSYCYIDSNSQTLLDQTINSNIELGIDPLAFPAGSNCQVGVGNLGTHTYTLNNPDSTSDVHFGMYAQDGACNTTNSASKLESPAAWIVTAHGSVSAGAGFTDFKIRKVATLAGIVPNLGADSFLSTYSAISGNAAMVSQFQSKYDYYTTNYADKSLLPPEISGVTNWFTYLYQLASYRQTVDTITLPTISGNFSTAFKVSANTKAYKYVNNDLTINSGSVCDLNAAIFVSGDLTIEPDLTKSNNSVGCIFIVKGNINFDNGTPKSPANTGTTKPSKYDTIEGAFITDNFVSTQDDQLASGTSSWTTGLIGGGTGQMHSAVSYGNKIYNWGGYNGGPTRAMYIYDPGTNTWAPGKAGGTARYKHTAVVYNGKMYVWGGFGLAGKLNSMDVYDFATSTWSVGTPGGTARYAHVAGVYGDKMYIWGGEVGNGVKTNIIDIYDFATNSWSTGTPGGTASSAGVGAVIADNMYMIGGTNGNIVDIYNFTSNTWSKGATLSANRSNMSAVVYNNQIYLWGGYNPKLTNQVDIYNPSTKTWSVGVAGGQPRYGHRAVVVNDKMYALEGVGGNGSYTGILDIYNFGTLLAGDALYIHGTVYAGKLSLQRNLGIAQNSMQPAEVFDYDPYYVRTYRNLFGLRNFSLRAQ